MKLKSESTVFALIGTIFTILKFNETINWSWWWVLSPYWIPITIMLIDLILTYYINKK
jgi:hypothetical protein